MAIKNIIPFSLKHYRSKKNEHSSKSSNLVKTNSNYFIMKHLYFFKRFYAIALVAAVSLLGLQDLHAQNPTYANATYTAGGNSIPLSWSSAGARGEQLYPVGTFGSVPSGMFISKIYMVCGSGGTGTAAYDHMKITMKQENVSALNSGSWTTGMEEVLFSTNYTIDNTIGQWFAFELETPFAYDPTLPLIVGFETHMSTFSAFYCSVTTAGGGWRAYANPYTAASPQGNGGYQMTFGFDLINASVPDNAGVNAIPSISDGFCAGSQDVTARIRNYGNNILDSVMVDWTVNGSSQGSQWFTLGLDSAAGSGTIDTVVNLGSYTFTNGNLYDVKVWTSMPNGVPDTMNNNDTTTITVGPAMQGTYVIGSSGGADYSNFSDAVSDLNILGVCDTVWFDVETGNYTEQFQIDQILGAAADRPVYFQSISGNASDVHIIQTATNNTTNYVVSLNGADHVSFLDMTIRNTTSGTYSNAFSITGSADSNTIDGCVIKAGPTTYTGAGNYSTGIYMYGNNHGNTFTNNRIEGGSCSIYAYGGGLTSRAENTTIDNNIIKNSYFYTIYAYYLDGLAFNNNTVTNDSAMYLYGYGPLFVYADNFNITNNFVGTDMNNGYYYGMYLTNSIGTNNPRSRVANNCINSGSETGASYGYYGFYSSGSGIFDFHHNSINRRGQSGSYYASYITNGGLISLMNNSFYNHGGGYALYAPGGFTISESENNNFYTSSGTLFYSGTSTYASLQDYQTATGYDMNSVETDPNFQDALTCVTCNDTLNGGGTPLVNTTTDINGNVRSAFTPDIGPVEFVNAASFTLGGDDTICGNEVIVEAGPAQSITWNVNNQTSTQSTVTLSANNEPINFNVSVSITTEYCGSAADNVVIRLIPDAVLDSSIHICDDIIETLNPGGGTNATYLWNTGATTATIDVDTTGTFTVTKMEEGCESQVTAIVTQSTAVEIADIEGCEEDAPISGDATIPDGSTYAWTGGSSTSTAANTFSSTGSYSVTATDNFGCVSSSDFDLLVLGAPEADISFTGSAGTAFLFSSAGSVNTSPNTTYLWTFNSIETSTAANPTYVFPWNGNPTTYPVSLVIDNGCGQDPDEINLTVDPLGVSDIAEEIFSIYPNPTKDNVQLTLTSEWSALELTVFDNSGRVVMSEAFNGGLNVIDVNVSNLAAGTYMLKVTSDEMTEIKALIVQ
jgi:hypothetical protein